MQTEAANLAEAARNLGLELVLPGEGEVKVRCPKGEFAGRLAALQKALECWDAAQGASSGNGPSEAARMRLALDALFRWMRATGMDVTEPHAVVAAALRGAGGSKSAPKPVPRFAAEQVGKSHGKRRPKPLLRLDPEAGEQVTLQSLRQKNLRADTLLTSMGNAAAR